MKFSGKMCLMIILKITKSNGFNLSLENTFFKKPEREGWVKLTPLPSSPSRPLPAVLGKNLITLKNFFKINPWFNASFRFLMWITYSVFLCKLATRFSIFSVFILSGKNGKSNKAHVTFQDIEHQLLENTLHHFSHYNFLWNLTTSVINMSIFKIWWFVIFIIILYIFSISFCISINCMTYSSSNSFSNH